MDLSLEATIAALASPPGSAARGIVRLSGNDVREVLAGWFKPHDRVLWQSSRIAAIHAGSLNLPHARTAIPVEVHLWPNRRSYTGQPIAELHLPGSPPLLEAVLAETHRRGAFGERSEPPRDEDVREPSALPIEFADEADDPPHKRTWHLNGLIGQPLRTGGSPQLGRLGIAEIGICRLP